MANVVFHGRWRREPAFKLHFTTLHALKGGRKVAICKILPPPLPLPPSRPLRHRGLIWTLKVQLTFGIYSKILLIS